MTQIHSASLNFLKSLSKNNNREWFNENKPKYLEGLENITGFADALLNEMKKHDNIETATGKKSLHRIYKDVRFSKDKTPYNTHWSGGFKRATKKLRGGYYFHIAPGNSFIAGGFWNPEPNDLLRIRQDIEINYKDWNKIVSKKSFIETFEKLKGEQLTSAPRGFAKDHPAIELLKHKQFLVTHEFSDKEVLEQGFAKKISDTYKKLRPFFDYMSEVLTTDLNGRSTID
jgi:uncharacterized protein (TIGR02453 family)